MSRLTIVLCLLLSVGFAEPRAQQPTAGRGLPPARPAGIDITTAQRMVSAAAAAAKDAGASVAIAIIDVNGDLVALERMDGASPQAVTSSQGKARAAVLFGLPTKAIQDAANAGKAITVTVTLPPPLGGAQELTPFQGGLPVMKDGKIVAGIGVGGSAPANDEKFAQAGVEALK
jgi:glc operon protein GlcG